MGTDNGEATAIHKNPSLDSSLWWPPKYHTSPHNTTLPQDQQVLSPGFVCLFSFCFFLMRIVAQIMGPDNNRPMFFFFFFILFHLTHVFFSLLLRVLPIQWNAYQYKPPHWRGGVMETDSCLESLDPQYAFLSHFFFLIGVFWADISLMYIGLPSC